MEILSSFVSGLNGPDGGDFELSFSLRELHRVRMVRRLVVEILLWANEH